MRRLTLIAMAGFACACGSVSAMTLGDFYALSPEQATTYMIGVYDAWLSRPGNEGCDKNPAAYIQAMRDFTRSQPADAANPKRKLDQAPAALVAQLQFDQECKRQSSLK